MPTKRAAEKEHVVYHKDGSIWARGKKRGDVCTGYWEWFRRDGTKLRSGFFENDEQTGEWTTYDQRGEVYKVTHFKPKPEEKSKK